MNFLDLSDRKDMFYWQTNRKISAEQTKEIFMNRSRTVNEEDIKKAVRVGMEKAGYSGADLDVQTMHAIIKQGSVNIVMPITLKSGLDIVIRMHPYGIKNGYFWVEKMVTQLARECGVLTYETIVVDDTHSEVPFDYMIMSRIVGKPIQDLLPLSPELEKTLIAETGKQAALIHMVKPSGFGFFSNARARTENKLVGQYDTFEEHLRAALNEDLVYLHQHQVITTPQKHAIEKIFDSGKGLMQCEKGVLIHNDIADWNQMSDGVHITGMMDWDECFSGDPLMELAAYSLFFGEPRLTYFKEGYNQIGKLEENEDKFQLFKLRYLISKMHLRRKRAEVDTSPMLKQNLKRGIEAMQEVFEYFKVS